MRSNCVAIVYGPYIVVVMGNQHGKTTSTPRRCRQVRFTDAEWAEIKAGAQAIGETRSEAIRAGSLSRVRQSIPDASDVTLPRGCVYCHRFTDMQDSLPAKGGGSAHAACAIRASLAGGST